MRSGDGVREDKKRLFATVTPSRTVAKSGSLQFRVWPMPLVYLIRGTSTTSGIPSLTWYMLHCTSINHSLNILVNVFRQMILDNDKAM